MSIFRTRILYLSVLCWLVPVGFASAQSGEYGEISGWPEAPTSVAGTPAAWNFGQVSGVATSANGYVLVLHRGAQSIMLFDAAGRFVRAWGDGLFSHGKVVGIAPEDREPGQSGYTAVYGPAGCYACGAHAIRVDPEGNLWVVDAAGHVVYKMDFQGRVLMELGTRGVAGMSENTFNLPTDVAFGADGVVYVTDRDNQRVEVFTADGEFLADWPDIGGNSALFLTSDQHVWTGGTLRTLDGEAIGTLSGGNGGHGMTVTGEGEVFVAQLSGRVQKFVKASDNE